jgi:hypothetical protein
VTSHDWLVLSTFVFEAVFWLGAYALIVRHSFREKIHGMPVVAMCGNISWEFILGLGLFPACPAYWADCPQRVMGPVTLLAAFLDAFILYTIVRFGRDQFQTRFIRKYFPALVLIGVATAAGIIYTFMADLYTPNIYAAQVGNVIPEFLQAGLQGGIFTGWGLALMMAILFIAMMVSRGDVRGQSFYIALFMGLGNLGAYLFDHTAATHMPAIVDILAVASLTLNAVYVVMVYRKSEALGIDPFRRF